MRDLCHLALEVFPGRGQKLPMGREVSLPKREVWGRRFCWENEVSSR